MMKKLRKLEHGQGLVDYALIIALVALIAIVGLGLIALAASHGYGIVGGVLGVRKDVQSTVNNIYFDTNPPQCGTWNGGRQLYMQFFSDVPIPDLSATTEDSSMTLAISTNGNATPGSGTGNLLISYPLQAGQSCPHAVVIQSDPAHGSKTVVWNVLQKDW